MVAGALVGDQGVPAIMSGGCGASGPQSFGRGHHGSDERQEGASDQVAKPPSLPSFSCHVTIWYGVFPVDGLPAESEAERARAHAEGMESHLNQQGAMLNDLQKKKKEIEMREKEKEWREQNRKNLEAV